MRILLTGCHGQVGWELTRVLPALGEVIATDRTALDLFYPDLVRQAVRNARPDVIVNAAAYTAVDRAESETDVAMEVNGVAPGVLAEEAKRLGALLVHYSTDYVFDGDKRDAYVEGDAPNPLNAYGRTKLEGERRITQSGCRHLILRTSWVYAPRGKNFYLTIRRKAAAGEALRVVDDQIGAPTSAAFIAEYTANLMQLQHTGLLHLVPSGSTSWYGFAREILRRSGSQARLEPIKSGEYPTAARRPANSTLDNSKAEAILRVSLPPWESPLERCMKEWKPA